MRLHYTPRTDKPSYGKVRRPRYMNTQCSSCDAWAHCLQRNKAWLCLTCRTEPEAP